MRKAPEGWLTTPELADQLGLRPEKVMVLVNEFRELHKRCIRQYMAPSGREARHFGPELITAITARLKDRPPEGWTHCIFYETEIRTKALEWMKEHPDDVKWFSTTSSPGLYYSPTFVQKVGARYDSDRPRRIREAARNNIRTAQNIRDYLY